jgi:hypothetical protein
MRHITCLLAAALALVGTGAEAASCRLKPKQVVERFVEQFYVQKKVREAFETCTTRWPRLVARQRSTFSSHSLPRIRR